LNQHYMSDRVLLILTPCYPDRDSRIIGDIFVKGQIEELREYFKKIIVISPILFSFKVLQNDKQCENYCYENIEIFYPRCIYIPIFWTGPLLIDTRLKVIENFIKINNINFDIIHAHFTWPFSYIGIKLKEKFGKPVIVTVHEDGDWFQQEARMNHPLINTGWSNADALIRVNKKDVPALRKFNEMVFSIPNGYSPNFFPMDISIARGRLGLPDDKRILFALGYLIKRKGFNYLIDAMKQICNGRGDVICYIGGAGPEMKKLQQQIVQSNLNEKIHLLGSVPNEILTTWINAADFFVMPSLNEGNPTVMFEALGCGKPFIGTKVGGVPEVIISEEYGLLVEPADAGDLAEKILVALNRDWDRDRILAYASQYTWKNIAKEIMGVYSKVSR